MSSAAAAIDPRVSVQETDAPKDRSAQELTEAEFRNASFGSTATHAAGTVAKAGIDILGRCVEGLDYLLDVPGKLVGAAVRLIPGGKVFGDAAEAVVQGICHFSVHAPNLGGLKWIKHLRRSSAVNGTVSDELAPDKEVDSVTVKSFLSTIKDDKLRGHLKDYFIMNKSLEMVTADTSMPEQERTAKSAMLNAGLARLEIVLSQRAELNEMKELAGLKDDLQKVSETRLDRLAESMADKMISKVQSHYKDRLGFIGSEMKADWASLAADGETGRPALVRKIKERLMEAYMTERENGSAKPQVELIRKDLADAFGSTASFKSAALFTTAGVIWYSMPVLGPVISDLGSQAAGWLKDIAPQLMPEWLINGFANLAQGLKSAGEWIMWLSGGWLGYKALDTAGRIFGNDGSHARPADGVRVDGNHQHVDGTRPADGSFDARVGDGSTHTAGDAASRAGDGSSLLDSVRAQADMSAHDSTATRPMGDTSGSVRSPIDTVGRGVDPVHAPRPVADVRATDLQGRPVDPSIRVETTRVNPR